MMRTWVVFLLLSLSTVAVCAQADRWSGSWTGTWTGQSGGGDMHLKLTQADGQWKAEAGFTIEGAEVPTVVKSLKIDGDTIDFQYSFDLQGYKLISHLTAKRTDRTVEGAYQTTAEDGSEVDNGKWKLTLK
jgi:hypothetical protein